MVWPLQGTCPCLGPTGKEV
eukprot:Nitzschia sp. Nitz4//scaffold82_size85912//19248//19307//NITZ4_005130-RA/size85912-exonerate_protein2genome-gene-0.83-mRNA-1//-1//CDS//3329558802//7029//frame0